ncbi:MAG: 50S ribosomal protein L21 [Bacteroidota bacterium]|nr:50S ribosomal protein L21 [Bacteroidota bacterium]
MFAVVNIAGQQLKVSPGERVFVPKLTAAVGSTVKFDRVLLMADETNVQVGNPFLKNKSIAAKVLGTIKDDKVTVFKKKRRKGYRLQRGHRQQYTEIEITTIG